METYDIRQDDYIANAAEFAQPILIHLRQLIHDAAPQIQETMKWSMPFYDYKGPVCQLAGFKQHCTFGFWKGSLLSDQHNILERSEAMGHLGRITTLAGLPTDEILIQYIQEAVELNEKGVKIVKAKSTVKTPLVVPGYFADLLKEHPQAEIQFNAYSYSHKKEYLEWITEAKTEATRQKRMLTAIQWLSEVVRGIGSSSKE
ncbi:YdeI family protein [Mucilaginibacter terrae]|uniref:YdeI/OmpD-associated family protein n=1 Tax=Mucilaginibacter terrae TaxID=1955052 RepID=UPI0036351258